MTRSFARMFWSLVFLPLLTPVADAVEKNASRNVFNDDGQVLAEAPGEGAAAFIKSWLDRESRAVPFTTFVFLACMPDICFYDTKVGERYGARNNRTNGPYVKGIHDLMKQGTDPLRLVTEHMQAKGKEVLAAVRMGDTHHIRINKYDDLCSQFSIDHPEYIIKQPDGRTNETALDYSFAAVREHRMGIMSEIITEYPVDGLELNFVRWAKHFPRQQGREKAPIMTRYVGQIREMMDESGRHRENGKRLTLGVRVPESLHACWLAGVDIETWVKQGWIDFVVVSTWNNTDPQTPVDEFARFTRPAGVDTIVTMGNMIGSFSAGVPLPLDRGVATSAEHARGYLSMLLNTAEARGAAANFYTYGADSISFWNVGAHFGRAVTAAPEQRKRIAAWTQAVQTRQTVFAGPRTYRFLPMSKGISQRKPPFRNYPWYDEGFSVLGHKNSPTLLFSEERIGKRLAFPFRVADGRCGERLAGLFRFWFYHVTNNDHIDVDINGVPVDKKHILRTPAGKLRGGLKGTRFEIDLAHCPPFRGDNVLGLLLATRAQRPHVPMMEELEVHVTGVTHSKSVSPDPANRTGRVAGTHVIKNLPRRSTRSSHSGPTESTTPGPVPAFSLPGPEPAPR